ncbi:glycosyltransferase [Lacrimispora saccharolytica]|uniref:Glycosyl transferase group 1 n=1 Tax=Lacrimispora saccharolytica (strain ATCC 35040 / DSM 2544 / NRCC 2533 / WM1) TaxID=610130 RepID=D9R4J2_LACSW|nr:glycosyltransferase [Lacrimispora saccharolytica]ADL03176.1 glycosyl transferase group 1 [[Clostridium] saccharolyticum WM1]QRV18649.1 glycosyltransferase [Lacrimispora saccharolytica]
MKKLLFVITQFYKGGAEVALLNLFHRLSPEEYEIDFLIFDQMILKEATSLIPQIPEWVNVCNAAEPEGHLAVVKKIWFKIYRRVTKHQLYRKRAYNFIKGKEYDAAFSYGEWMSPEFVAQKVKAKKKMVWIHADIDKAAYVDERILFGYDRAYDRYLFVSEQSRKAAEQAFLFLKGKCSVVHNMCDDQEIYRLAKEPLSVDDEAFDSYLLSVANLREEKNYPRMIETMKCLCDMGVEARWLCIGSTANVFILNKVKSLLAQYQLEDRFILLGACENPYKYMSRSKAVLVLSDFESWSLVITEAKLLGIPVVATKTSGALEQIQDRESGILVSFEPKDIANSVKELLENQEIQEKIRINLGGFSTQQKTLEEFLAILED